MPGKRNIGSAEKQKNGSANVSPPVTRFPGPEGLRREIYIFRSADAFHEASLLALRRATTTDNETQRFNLGLVYGVNGALAVELHLQLLLEIEGKQVPETHDLQKLYLQLGRESRAKLKKRHDELAKDHHVRPCFSKRYGI